MLNFLVGPPFVSRPTYGIAEEAFKVRAFKQMPPESRDKFLYHSVFFVVGQYHSGLLLIALGCTAGHELVRTFVAAPVTFDDSGRENLCKARGMNRRYRLLGAKGMDKENSSEGKLNRGGHGESCSLWLTHCSNAVKFVNELREIQSSASGREAAHRRPFRNSSLLGFTHRSS